MEKQLGEKQSTAENGATGLHLQHVYCCLKFEVQLAEGKEVVLERGGMKTEDYKINRIPFTIEK